MTAQMLTEAELHAELQTLLKEASAIQSWGETAYFYNPGAVLKRGVYICTVKNKDGENDSASGLNRAGLFRLNIGIPKPDYVSLFGPAPARPAKGQSIAGPWDFKAVDQLLPHPVYAWMGWVSTLNPSRASLERLKRLLLLAEDEARVRFEKRIKRLR